MDGTIFANEKTHLRPTLIEHMQCRCMAGNAKVFSFLVIFCSSVCARLLLLVRCPLMYIHYSRRMVLTSIPPFTCLLVTTSTGPNHWKQTGKITNRSEKGRMILRCNGLNEPFTLISNHANDYTLSSVHNERFNNHSSHFRKFTPIMWVVPTKHTEDAMMTHRPLHTNISWKELFWLHQCRRSFMSVIFVVYFSVTKTWTSKNILCSGCVQNRIAAMHSRRFPWRERTFPGFLHAWNCHSKENIFDNMTHSRAHRVIWHSAFLHRPASLPASRKKGHSAPNPSSIRLLHCLRLWNWIFSVFQFVGWQCDHCKQWFILKERELCAFAQNHRFVNVNLKFGVHFCSAYVPACSSIWCTLC